MKTEHLLTFLIVGIIPIILAYLNHPWLMVAFIYIGGTYFVLRSNYKHW